MRVVIDCGEVDVDLLDIEAAWVCRVGSGYSSSWPETTEATTTQATSICPMDQ